MFQLSVLQRADATQNVNVALKRPAWQSSIYCDGHGCHGAYKANDGIMVTSHSVQPGCAHTDNVHLNPWLAIDLGVPIYVDCVDVTSRGVCCGE